MSCTHFAHVVTTNSIIIDTISMGQNMMQVTRYSFLTLYCRIRVACEAWPSYNIRCRVCNSTYKAFSSATWRKVQEMATGIRICVVIDRHIIAASATSNAGIYFAQLLCCTHDLYFTPLFPAISYYFIFTIRPRCTIFIMAKMNVHVCLFVLFDNKMLFILHSSKIKYTLLINLGVNA